jgi:hypothetical protein
MRLYMLDAIEPPAEPINMAITTENADHFNMEMGDDPYWSESSWFSWAIPERGINGLFYNHFRPNMNCLLAGPAMWDGSGEHVWEFLYYDWQLMRVPPPGRYGVDYDKYDWQAPWSMSIRTLEPLKRYRLGYDRNGFKLDLIFTAVAPPNEIGGGWARASERAYKLHFEQPGRIEGTVDLDGERFDVDCFSIRDGSHGPRFLEETTPGGYSWSTASETSGWHLLARDVHGSRETEVVGGYILRDGQIASVVRGVRRVVERDGPRPVSLEVELEDTLGRRLEAVGRAQTPAEFMLFPDRGQWWQLYQWDYDGHSNAVGEDQEYYGIHDFRRWHRAGPGPWSKR